MKKIAVLLTVFNRKTKTLECLQRLYALFPVEGYKIDIYLTDDGCTDGTPEAIKLQFPQVNIIHGDGDLYWNRGMYKAWQEAAKKNYDFYLWLNDDTFVYSNLFSTILETSKIKDKAVAQMTAMEDKNTVVTQTTAQESSSQQQNGNLSQNNAQEQVVKMSVEANSDTGNVQFNGAENFVSKMDAGLSAASKTSSSMQNTLNTNSIMEQVNKQFEHLQQSTANKVTIVLQPENLGRVSVEIMNTKDGITAKMMTDSQQVKDLFDKNIEALKSNLSAQGVNVNNIKVECAQESSNNAMNFEREQFNQSFNNPNSSNHNQTNQSNSQTVYTNTDNLNFDDAETDINSGVEIKNIQTMIKHNGKVDYKV